MPRKIAARSRSTVQASARLCRYRLQLKRGSWPPLPSGTDWSQYWAMRYSDHLSTMLASIRRPRPKRLCNTMSYQCQAGLLVQADLNEPSQVPL